jgi:serine/threonine protein kinase
MERGYCCLVMEYCSGGDLEKILEKGKTIEQSVFFYLIIIVIFLF